MLSSQVIELFSLISLIMPSFKAAAILLATTSITDGFVTSRIPSHIGQRCSGHNDVAFTLCESSSTEAGPVTEYTIETAAEEFSTLAQEQSKEEEPVITDTTAPVTSSSPSLNVAETQKALLLVAASTDRGQYANIHQKEQVSSLLSQLESTYQPTPSDDGNNIISPSLTGTWSLVYSNTQLFRSSPFFQAARTVCKTSEEVQQFEWFCNMHRAALAISTIGEVRQVISKEGRLTNEFEVKAGAVPFLSDFTPFRYSGGLPITVDGAIVSTADVTTNDNGEWEIYMDTVEIKGSNIPGLRSILDMDDSKLKSRDLSKILEDNVDSYEVPRPVLRTTFVDDSMRIVRDEDDNVFVYGKMSDSEDPKDYSDILPDLGVAGLLEGFNDAVTKFYL